MRPLQIPLKMWLVLLLSVLVFIGGLGQKDLVTSHEARVAQTARAMVNASLPWSGRTIEVPKPILVDTPDGKRFIHSGETIGVNPWIVPVMNGEIRLNKPPLPYWCSAVSFGVLGRSEFAARVPTAMLGALATLLMYQLGTLLFSRGTGFAAAMLWISSYFVVDEFRKSMADPYLAFFTLLAIFAFLRNGAWVLMGYVAIALGLLAKGPVIVLTTLPAVLLLRTNPKRLPAQWLLHLLGVLFMIAITMPWVFAVLHAVPNARELWLYDAFESVEKARPFWMYFVNLFQLTLPWTPFWIIGCILPFVRRHKTARTRRQLRVLGWAAILIVCFSIKPVKKNAYLLPVMPAMILISAEAVMMLVRNAKSRSNRPLPWTLMAICAAIGIGFACAVAGFTIRNYSHGVGVAAALVALVAAIPPLLEIARGRRDRWLVSQAVGFSLILVLFLTLWNAAIENARSPRPMAESVLQRSREESIPIALSISPEEMSFYLPADLPSWRESDRVLLVLDRPTKEGPPDDALIQSKFPQAIVGSWTIVRRDPRYVVVDVLLNRNRM